MSKYYIHHLNDDFEYLVPKYLLNITQHSFLDVEISIELEISKKIDNFDAKLIIDKSPKVAYVKPSYKSFDEVLIFDMIHALENNEVSGLSIKRFTYDIVAISLSNNLVLQEWFDNTNHPWWAYVKELPFYGRDKK
jgi:hypothetical protein